MKNLPAHKKAPIFEECKLSKLQTMQNTEDLIKLKDKYLELTQCMVNYDKINQYRIMHHSTVTGGFTLTGERKTPKPCKNTTRQHNKTARTVPKLEGEAAVCLRFSNSGRFRRAIGC